MKTFDVVLRPLAPMGAEVKGIDLRDELPESIKDKLRDAWRTYGLLLFRDQTIEKEDQLRAAAIFGDILIQGEAPGGINFVTNVVKERGVGANGEFMLYNVGAMQFHIDHSFHLRQPSGLMLYGIEVTKEGGETTFSDSRLALRSLPAKLRERIAGLTIRHHHHLGAKGTVSDKGWPGYSDHPMIRRHPVTGEEFLFMSRRHLPKVLDLPEDESEALLDELYTYVSKPENVYVHKWQAKDLVFWDNIALQHGRNDYDQKERRHMRKAQIV